MICYLML